MPIALEHGLRVGGRSLMGGMISRVRIPWLRRRWALASEDRIAPLTGLSAERWRELAAFYPELPRNPGPAAARARARLHRLAARALSTGRWAARLEGEPPSPSPAVYVSAHIGSLQALRYTLRARGVPAALVLGPFNRDRTEAVKVDAIFDRRYPLAFPHALHSSQVHRLRGALKTGSLILAADLPEGRTVESTLLGATVQLDPRPFRLARAAGVPCRAAFLTIPEGRWTLTLGRPLPAGEIAACHEFARCLGEVASRAPLDIDAVVYGNLARSPRAASQRARARR